MYYATVQSHAFGGKCTNVKKAVKFANKNASFFQKSYQAVKAANLVSKLSVFCIICVRKN